MPTARFLLSSIAVATFCVSALRAEIATWTNLDGQSMQAEFLGRKGDYVSFRRNDGAKYLYNEVLAALRAWQF